jgi:ABC-2 type transport system ATP-binding protein
VRYGARQALSGLDLEVGFGEVVGILGPNGAGKTSLLRLLCTGRLPSGGTLVILGHPVSPSSRSLVSLRRQIGIAGDEAVHTDALTGQENLEFFAQLGGLERAAAQARGRAILSRFGLDSDADRPVAHYSLGMRRKLLLAQALVHDPRLIILDEPTTGLDKAGRDALRSMLRERAASGAAIVLASNDPLEPQRVCDRVIFLHKGRVILAGKPDELIARLGASEPVEIRRPDLADVFLAATGAELVPDSRFALRNSPS